MMNSTRSGFCPSTRKSLLAKRRSKKTKGWSKRMNKIAKAVSKSQAYMRQPNKRGNINGNRRNDDRTKPQTHGATSKVASKEIPITSKWKENISSVEISRKERKVGKPCNATMNNYSKSSKPMASPSSRLHMLSPSQGIRSVPSTGREERGKEKVMQDCHDHLRKNARPMRSEPSTRRERGNKTVTQDCLNYLGKDACPMRSEPSTRREGRGKEKVTQDRHNPLEKNACPMRSELKVMQERHNHLGKNAHPIRWESSSRLEERGKEKVMQNYHNPLEKNVRPMCGDDLLRDGKNGGLRISNKRSTFSTLNHVNKIKLGKRNLEGCSQGRIPNALVGKEDDVGDVESAGVRKGQMGKKCKTNVNDVSEEDDGDLKSSGVRKGQMGKKCKTNVNEVSEDSGHLASNDSVVKKKCRGFEVNEDGQNSGLVKDDIFGVLIPTVAEAIKGHCSLPVDEPIWSGIFKIDGKEYVSLAGHLSTKSCEKVCMLSRSLPPLVNVTKHSRLEVWPSSLGTSGFTDENVSLFLFPPKMRPDGKLDQLVKEVLENDRALRAVLDKTEMLIFPSTMLPKQYQAFQGKHYLWGLFRPRKDMVGLAEEQAAHAMSPMENAKSLENQEGSKDGTEQVEFSGVPEPNMDTEPEDPEGAKMQDAADQNLAPALGGSNASRSDQPSMVATLPANREQMDASLEIPPGRMFAFVAQPTPRFEELMRELEREGALIATMPRVTTEPGQGQGLATATK